MMHRALGAGAHHGSPPMRCAPDCNDTIISVQHSARSTFCARAPCGVRSCTGVGCVARRRGWTPRGFSRGLGRCVDSHADSQSGYERPGHGANSLGAKTVRGQVASHSQGPSRPGQGGRCGECVLVQAHCKNALPLSALRPTNVPNHEMAMLRVYQTYESFTPGGMGRCPRCAARGCRTPWRCSSSA